MNNDLSGVLKEADPNEVIKELQTAYQEVREENKRLRAEMDQEKRKEAIAFLEAVTEEGCNNYFRIGDSWFLGEETDDDPEGPFTSEQLYDQYLKSKIHDNG